MRPIVRDAADKERDCLPLMVPTLEMSLGVGDRRGPRACGEMTVPKPAASSIRHMADRPIAECDVLRCTDPVHRVIRVSPPDRLLRQARLCYEHSEAIERGDRWMWDYGGGSGGVGQAASIVMGRDLPPIIRTFQAFSGHFSNLGGTEMVRLELLRGSGSVTDVEFELDPQIGRRLVSWLGARVDESAIEGENSEDDPA